MSFRPDICARVLCVSLFLSSNGLFTLHFDVVSSFQSLVRSGEDLRSLDLQELRQYVAQVSSMVKEKVLFACVGRFVISVCIRGDSLTVLRLARCSFSET